MTSLLKTASGYLSKYPWLESVLIATLVWLITVPTWAISPQSGDAAEQIMTAIQGGVLHPPGFPLQAVLNRLFVLLPFGTPAYRISFLDSLGLALMAFALLEILRRLGCDRASRIAGMAAAVFFPIFWFLGVHPEVFSLANAAVALAFAASDDASPEGKRGNDHLGCLSAGRRCGTCLVATHDYHRHFTGVSLLGLHLLRAPGTRLKHFAVASLSLLVPFFRHSRYEPHSDGAKRGVAELGTAS